MLGYVNSALATGKTLAAAQSEVSKYFGWYPTLAGIFVDSVSSSCTQLAYYQALVTHIRSFNKDAVVVFNWGAGAGAQAPTSAVNVCVRWLCPSDAPNNRTLPLQTRPSASTPRPTGQTSLARLRARPRPTPPGRPLRGIASTPPAK
jgi:hypothetical protein